MLTEVSGSMGLVSNILHFRASRNRCWKAKENWDAGVDQLRSQKASSLGKACMYPGKKGLLATEREQDLLSLFLKEPGI